MKEIAKKLIKDNPVQNILYGVGSTLNLIVIGVFLMLVKELIKIKKNTALISRNEQISFYFSTLITISIIVIIFSVLVLCMIQKSVFHSRRDFNIKMKLTGISSICLAKIYIKEIFTIQKITIPLGILLMQLTYTIISRIVEIPSKWISITIVVSSIILHIMILFFSSAIILCKLSRFNPLEKLRNPYMQEKVRILGKRDYILFFVGIGLIGIPLIYSNTDNSFMAFIPIVGIFLIIDVLLVMIHNSFKKIGQTNSMIGLYLSESMILGYYKKMNSIVMTLIVGVMISVGLIGMFNTIRGISKDTVNQNLYYQTLVVYSKVKSFLSEKEYKKQFDKIDPHSKIAYGINLELTDKEGIKNTISAIDNDYFKYGEKLKIINHNNISKNILDENFNGIYLPDYFINEKDIGKKWPLKLGNKTLDLIIAGRFHANGDRGRFGFISKSFLQKFMSKPGFVNAFYVNTANQKLTNEIENNSNAIDIYKVSKKQIAAGSYKNAIKGTEIFELSSNAIILLAIIMVFHFYFSTSLSNYFDISRLRAQGISISKLINAYFLQVFCVITLSFLVGTALSIFLFEVGWT